MGQRHQGIGGWPGQVQQGRKEFFCAQCDQLAQANNGHVFQGYETFGLNAQPNGDIKYREWAPNAVEASLVGDFSMYIQVEGKVKEHEPKY